VITGKVGERAVQSKLAVPLDTWLTAILKAGKEALLVPSVTLMTMFE